MSTSEGDGKCSEYNVVISEGIYYLKLFIKGELRGKNDYFRCWAFPLCFNF